MNNLRPTTSPPAKITLVPRKRLHVADGDDLTKQRSTLCFSHQSDSNSAPETVIGLPLPDELHDHILETFWDRKNIECSSADTIRACALTCKAWHRVARRHVFRVIILRSWDKLQEFVSLALQDAAIMGWVQRVRLCGSLPPLDKTSSGMEIPSDWGTQDRWIYYFPYSLAPHIQDAERRNQQPFNIKILEIFDFGHVSGAVEDCEWYAFWIQHLPWLNSVHTLYLKSCELASNALTAIVCSLPQLRNVGLTNVDLTTKNHAFVSPRATTLEERELEDQRTLKLFEEMVKKEGGDWEALLRQRVVPNGVEYVVAHWPPPPLESIYVNNSSTQYAPLRLARLDSWAEGVWVRKTLRSLGICTGVDVPSLAYYLRDLKFSPALQNLNIWAGYPLDTRTSSNRK